MPTAGWTLDLVRRWVAPTRVRWRRRALAGATVVAFAASVVGAGDQRCSVDDLTVCGPDPLFSAALALVAASVALLWWRPWVAAACAVGFAALDLAYDDVWAARLMWPVVAALHLAHVWALRRESQEQLALAEAGSGPVPAGWARTRPGSSAASGSALPVAAAVVLAAVAGASLLMLARAEAADRSHLAGSVVVRAAVTGWEDDLLRVRIERPPAGVPAELSLDSLDDHAPGDVVVVRVDPTDLGWSHLEAEPPDPTWWLTVATAAGLLAALLAARSIAGRMRRGALAQHPPTEGVAVRYALDEGGTALLVLPRDDVVFGYVDLLPGPQPALPDEAVLAEELRPGVLVGTVRPGGWCALATEDGLLLPDGPLSAEPELPPVSDVEGALDAEDPRSWSFPVPDDATPAALPVALGPSSADRLVGAGAAVLAVAVVSWMVGWEEASWFQGLFLVALAGEVAHWGVDRAVRGVRVDGQAVHTVSALRREVVPLWAVEEVRCTPHHVVLTFVEDAGDGPGAAGSPGRRGDIDGPGDPDAMDGVDDVDDPMEGILEIGPFGEALGRHGFRPAGEAARGATVVGPTAAEVAAALDLARVVRSAARGAGDAREEAESRLGPGVPWLVLAAAVLVGSYLWVVLG